jgi:hypothetical protein
MSVRPILLQEIEYSIIVSLHQCILVWLPLIYVSTLRGQKELLFLKINKAHSDYYIYQHLNMDVSSRITSTESTILLDTPYVMWRFYSSFHNWHNTRLSPCTNMSTKLLFQASRFALHLLLPQFFYQSMWLKALNICKELSLQTWHIRRNWKNENSTACVLIPSQWQVGGV